MGVGPPGAVGVRRDGLAPTALPVGLVLAGAISVQTGAGIADRLFGQLPPAAVTTLRLWAGALVLLLVAGRPTARALADLRQRRAWSDAAITAAFGLALGLMNFAIYQAFARIPLGIAVTIEFLGPLTVTVTAGLTRRGTVRERTVALSCAALAAVGVILLGNSAVGHLNWAGVAWAVTAGACWACYIIGSKAIGQRLPGASGLVVGMVVAAAAVTAPGLAAAGTRIFRPDFLAIGAAIGILSSVIPYWLELEALRRIPAQLFGVWMSLQPAVAALIGLIFLSQRLSPAEWIGIACVIAASAAASRPPTRSEPTRSEAYPVPPPTRSEANVSPTPPMRSEATAPATPTIASVPPTWKPAPPSPPTGTLGAGAIPSRRSAHRVMVRGLDAPESAPSPEPRTAPETPAAGTAAEAAQNRRAEPNASTPDAVNGALAWCACFPD